MAPLFLINGDPAGGVEGCKEADGEEGKIDDPGVEGRQKEDLMVQECPSSVGGNLLI